MIPIKIRAADPKDFDALCAISSSVEILQTWQMEQASEEGVLTTRFREVPLPRPVHLNYPYQMNVLRNHLEGNAVNLVAEVKAKPVAFLSLDISGPFQAGRVTDLVVEESHRRQGIATSLLVSAADWVLERKIRSVAMEMLAKNFPGVSMARKLGFRFAGFSDIFFPNGQTAVFFHRVVN